MTRPPRFAERLMGWSLPPADRDAMLGDLAEEFAGRDAADGARVAQRWYRRQVRKSLAPNLRRRFSHSTARPADGLPLRRARPWESFMSDLRYAFRALASAPSFTLVAVLVLTLGIGATTAIFSVVDAVVLRGLPFDEHDRLVAVGERFVGADKFAPPGGPDAVIAVQPQNYLDWLPAQKVFASIGAMAGRVTTIHEPGSEPEDLITLRVAASLFDVLRVRPVLGHAFTVDQEIDGRHRVAILSDGYWRRRFGAAPDVLGRTIPLDDGAYEIVGVMAPDVSNPFASGQAVDLWIPYVVPENERVRRGHSIYLQVVARLRPGVSVDQAQAQMDQVAAAIEQANPDWNRGNKVGVRPLRDHLVGANTRSWMLMLLGAVGIVLLIACANVANLLIARASTREREIAVRAALGAGRWRLVRQLLIESLLLAAVSTALAILLALWGVDVLKNAMPDGLPRVAAIALNYRMLAAAAGLALLTGLSFGLVPALQLSKPDLTTSLKDGTRGASAGRGRRRLRSALVVVEVALAVVLLVGASLFIGSFIALLSVDPGFKPDHVLTAFVSPRAEAGRPRPDATAAFDDIVTRISQTPGVVQAAMVSGGIPLGTSFRISGLRVPGRAAEDAGPKIPGKLSPDAGISIKSVSPTYHQTLGIPLRRGRLFAVTDTRDAPKVVIINESTARKYFPGEEAVGQIVDIDNAELTVVGVVGDIHTTSLEVDPRAEVYLPMAQGRNSSGELVIRTSGDPYAVLPAVKVAVLRALPDVPLRTIRTMDELIGKRMAQRRLNMLLLGLFGVLALVISAAGIYGVMAYVVSQRTREIGVRMALGATRSTVMKLVTGNAMLLVLTGLVIGGIGAWYLAAAAKAFLFKLDATDPRAFAAAVVALLVAGFVASAIPARRAAAVDPAVALRAE